MYFLFSQAGLSILLKKMNHTYQTVSSQSESIRFVAPPYLNLYGLLHRLIRIYPVSTISEVKVQLEKLVSLVDCWDMCGSEMLFSFSQATLSIFVSYLRRTPLAYVP
jgi:hypothetical protein